MDSAASSKRKRAGSSPAESARAAFDYWLGREVLNLEERDRYSHAVPTSWPMDWVRSLRTIAMRFDSAPRHQMLSRPDAALRLRSAAMQFDSARERRKVESAFSERRGATREIPCIGTIPVWSNGRTRAFEAQGRGSIPRTGTGEVSPPGEGCGFTRRRARFDSETSYKNEDRNAPQRG